MAIVDNLEICRTFRSILGVHILDNIISFLKDKVIPEFTAISELSSTFTTWRTRIKSRSTNISKLQGTLNTKNNHTSK
jgi:hypothetical protein